MDNTAERRLRTALCRPRRGRDTRSAARGAANPRGHISASRWQPGTAARIFTGAGIPEGADAVVMQEDASVDGDHVVIGARPSPGEWIRRAGEDIREGAVILPAGTRLSPQATGLAASVGSRAACRCTVACASPASSPATNW